MDAASVILGYCSCPTAIQKQFAALTAIDPIAGAPPVLCTPRVELARPLDRRKFTPLMFATSTVLLCNCATKKACCIVSQRQRGCSKGSMGGPHHQCSAWYRAPGVQPRGKHLWYRGGCTSNQTPTSGADTPRLPPPPPLRSRQIMPDQIRSRRRLVEQLPPDEHAPDLTRARADLIQLGVAQQATGRVVVCVPVAAKDL